MTTETAPLSQRLKTETQPLHDEAERHELQRAFLKGELSREMYVAHMEQMLLVHQALERALRAAAQRDERVDALVREEYFQAPRLMRDLAHFGVDGALAGPTPATSGLCARLLELAEARPAALIGHLYVLEGSNNGGRFIARAVRKAYALEDDGATWLDPYGEEQRGKWTAFKTTLDELEFDDAEQHAIVDAACDMFRAISLIGDDVTASAPAVVTVKRDSAKVG